MANGLFATKPMNTAGEIQRLMQLEQEKRIRDAGAGFSNPLVRARAMAGQGMQEAISGIGTGLTGLLGGQVRMDPRMQEALKRDKDRKELLAMYNNADTDGDGKVSLQEYRALAKQFRARGYQAEAQEVLKEAEREYGTGFQRMQLEAKRTKQDRDYLLSKRTAELAEQRFNELKRKNASTETINRARLELDNSRFDFRKQTERKRIELEQERNRLTENRDNINSKVAQKRIAKINKDLKELPTFDALDKDEMTVMISTLNNDDFVKLLPDSVKRFLRGVKQEVKVRIGQQAKDIFNEARRGGTRMSLEDALKQAIRNFATGNTNPSDTQGGRGTPPPPATGTRSPAANYGGG